MWYMLKEIQRKQDKHERKLETLTKTIADNEIQRLKTEIAVLRGQPPPLLQEPSE